MTASRLTIQDTGDQIRVKIAGAITASTEFPKVNLKPDQKSILLQLEDAGYVNSGGVQNWTAWMNELKKSANVKILIQMLPSNFAKLSYTIQDFLPKNAQIESFLASYFCENCSENFVTAFKKGQNWKSEWSAEELVKNISSVDCPKCRKKADIDTSPDVYRIF